MGYGQSASGLQCSWGSDLDTRIPRAKLPPSALPPEVRAKLKLGGLKHAGGHADKDAAGLAYKPGGGCLEPRASDNGQYKAGCQKNFLRRGSGVPASERCSAPADGEERPAPAARAAPQPLSGRAAAPAEPHRVQPGPAVCLIGDENLAPAFDGAPPPPPPAAQAHECPTGRGRVRAAPAGSVYANEVRRMRQPRHARRRARAPSSHHSLGPAAHEYETRIRLCSGVRETRTRAGLPHAPGAARRMPRPFYTRDTVATCQRKRAKKKNGAV